MIKVMKDRVTYINVTEEEYKLLKEKMFVTDECPICSGLEHGGEFTVVHCQTAWFLLMNEIKRLRGELIIDREQPSLVDQYQSAMRDLIESQQVYGPIEFIENVARMAKFNGIETQTDDLGSGVGSLKLNSQVN